MIRAGSPVSGTLLDAMSSASDSLCETALIELRDSTDDHLRKAATYALSRMPRPGSEAIATMKAILIKEPFEPTALYALGSFCKHLRDEGKTGEAAALGEYLVARLAQAREASDKIVALRAIENSSYEPAIKVLPAYFSDADEIVMSAAFKVLRPMKDPGVDSILIGYFKSRAPVAAKVAIMETVRARPASPKMATALVAAAGNTEAKVRYQVIAMLSEWLPKLPELRPMLERYALQDPDAGIRNRARDMLKSTVSSPGVR